MESYYIMAKEAAPVLRLSEGKTYEIFRDLNKELKSQGFVTVAGRVPRAYFNKKFFGGVEKPEGGTA